MTTSILVVLDLLCLAVTVLSLAVAIRVNFATRTGADGWVRLFFASAGGFIVVGVMVIYSWYAA